MSEINPNAVTGLATNLNTKDIIGRFIEIEKRQVAPIEQRKQTKVVELESWDAIKTELEKLQEISLNLTQAEVWEAKKVESSDPNVISAKAKRLARPGKTTIAVDSVALAHQITSQGFAEPTDNVGTGTIRIQVGDEEDRTPVTIRINDGNNTLEGIRQAINDSGASVEAFVIKTGSAEKPYQLMLTSKEIGEQGRIYIEVKLEGGAVDPPTYKSTFDTIADWGGTDAIVPETVFRGIGSSTPIMGVDGTYTGENDVKFTFTVAQSGTVNSERGLELLWTDTEGRQGTLKLNKFNYVPGTPVDVIDGIELLISDGEVVGGDSFTVNAHAEKSELLWWLGPEERVSRIDPPSSWGSKATEGGIQISGKYTGEEDQSVVFRVEGSGQVGGPKSLILHYEFTETGERGQLNIGYPYLSENNPGALKDATAFDALDNEELFRLDFSVQGSLPKRLSIGNGLFIEIPPVILNDGDTAELDVNAPVPDSFWWKPEKIRGYDGKVDTQVAWNAYVDEDGNVSRPDVQDGILGAGRQKSTAPIEITGSYLEDLPKTYTFVVKKAGTVGITRGVMLEWNDGEGRTGRIDVGEGYQLGRPVPFDSGLEVALGKGRLVEEDEFLVNTRTSTVQRPQDAILRLGASDLGGGIEIRRPSNTIDDIIQGVDLEILSTSEKPVTITVAGDTERAKELVRDFVEAYNTFNSTVLEFTKFDKQTNTAGPLLSDRNIRNLYNDLAMVVTSSVPGLPQSTNMLFSLGIRINDKGVMKLDESKLEEKFNDDYGAVANVFRSNGVSDNTSVDFVGLTQKTKINPNGYIIDITQAAAQGSYIGSPLMSNVIEINDTNNQLYILADGRKSDAIELRNDVYSPASLARELQSKLTNDKKIGKRRVRVEEDNGRLKIISGSYGKSSAISVEPGKDKNLMSLGLHNGVTTEGKDVMGTIGGVAAIGRGQLLVGPDGQDSEGLRAFVSLNQDQLQDGPEARIVVTRGIASILEDKLKKINDAAGGDVRRVTDDIGTQMKNFDEQIRRINKRIDSKREALQLKFTKLETTMGRLKSQQSYLGQQLSALGGGGGGGGNKQGG
ncbi:MAG: flagellar filament capping protein FliD [SAR324 cluster bacterium]|nr:flagellar filament capping protein FliD [SAR324 cluster bacterium]